NEAVKLYFDAALRELLFCVTTKGLAKLRQNTVAGMDQDDSGKPLVQSRIVFDCAEKQVVQRSSRFCSCKTTAGEDDRKRFLAVLVVRLIVGHIESVEHAIASDNCVAERLHR